MSKAQAHLVLFGIRLTKENDKIIISIHSLYEFFFALQTFQLKLEVKFSVAFCFLFSTQKSASSDLRATIMVMQVYECELDEFAGMAKKTNELN